MRTPLRQPGFTLIETLIALVIVVVILGGSIATGRAIQGAVQRSEDRIQMNALANESIDSIKLLRDMLKQGRQVGLGDSSYGLALAESSTYDTPAIIGTWVASQAQLSGCGGDSSQCPKAEDGGPIVLSWCNLAAASCQDASGTEVVSPVGVQGGCGNSCSLSQLVDSVNTAFGTKGDLIAIRRSPISPTDPERRTVLDAAEPLHGAAQATGITTAQSNDYSFYVRSVQVTRLGGCTGGVTDGSCSIDPLFAKDLGSAADANAALRSRTYKIDVSVINANDPVSTVRKTVIVTDW